MLSTILRRVSAVPPLRRLTAFLGIHSLLDVPSKERQVQNQGKPVTVDKEQKGQEPVDRDFREDVCVQAVAEVDGVDVVAACANDVSTGMTTSRRSPGTRGYDAAAETSACYRRSRWP